MAIKNSLWLLFQDCKENSEKECLMSSQGCLLLQGHRERLYHLLVDNALQEKINGSYSLKIRFKKNALKGISPMVIKNCSDTSVLQM